MESHKNIKAIPALLMIILISFFHPTFFDSAQAICVPRNYTFWSTIPEAHLTVCHNAANPSSISDHSPESAPSSSYYPPINPSPPQPSTPDAYPPVSHISAPSPASYLSPESAPTPSQSPGPRPFSDLPSKPTPTPPTTPPLISEPKLKFPLNPAIKKICEATDYPLLCLSSTAPFLTGKVDVISVLEVAVKACSLHAKLALSIASKVLKTKPGINSAAVSDCMEMYNDVLDNIESAVDALSARDTGTFNSMLSAVLTDYGTCEDGFAGERTPLSEVDDKGTKLASNCLAIASLIK